MTSNYQSYFQLSKHKVKFKQPFANKKENKKISTHWLEGMPPGYQRSI